MPPTTLRIRLASWLLSALVVLCWAISPTVGQEYTIGPRDVLGITVWGQADLSRDYGVDPDGACGAADGAAREGLPGQPAGHRRGQGVSLPEGPGARGGREAWRVLP